MSGYRHLHSDNPGRHIGYLRTTALRELPAPVAMLRPPEQAGRLSGPSRMHPAGLMTPPWYLPCSHALSPTRSLSPSPPVSSTSLPASDTRLSRSAATTTATSLTSSLIWNPPMVSPPRTQYCNRSFDRYAPPSPGITPIIRQHSQYKKPNSSLMTATSTTLIRHRATTGRHRTYLRSQTTCQLALLYQHK